MVRQPVLEEFCDCLVAGVDVAVALFHPERPVGVIVRRRCVDLVEAGGVVLAQDEVTCDEVLFELFEGFRADDRRRDGGAGS